MIKLGDEVKDRYSDWSGMVTMKMELMNGSRRFEVAGKDKEGMPVDHHFDEPQLELVKAAEKDLTPKPSGKVRLGSKVRDITSGWEGVATGFYLYLNGCVRIEVYGPGSKQSMFDKPIPKGIVLDEMCVEAIGGTITSQAPPRLGGSRSMNPLR